MLWRPDRDSVLLDGGEFMMGTDSRDGYPRDGEGPVHRVRSSPFGIDPHAVTNDASRRSSRRPGYVTDAERYGWSFVFGGLLPDDFEDTRGVAERRGGGRWRERTGAIPRDRSPTSTAAADHPVVHVSWNDAQAYCGGPARGCRPRPSGSTRRAAGWRGRRFPWGDELEPGGEHRMNVFQGTFPAHNTGADGYVGTAPVDAFAPNGYGLYNVTGNVWEWCADWFDPRYYAASPVDDPPGPAAGPTA